jgi:hypothetical protein
MGKEPNVYLVNQNIPKKFIKTSSENIMYYLDFANYTEIERTIKTIETPNIKIYDQTQTREASGAIFSVNDHINRIGHNPFIGNQQRFNIDFINIEKLYTQQTSGITTNSCGSHLPIGKYPSTHLANIAIMAHVFKFRIEAFLVNT